MQVQGSHVPEGSEVGDMLFEELGPDPPSTEFEGSDERGNAGGRGRDCRAPGLEARFVPEEDMFEDDQLTSNPPRCADQRTATEGGEVGVV